MRRKNTSVETAFHPVITDFLFHLDELYTSWGNELVITSGGEQTAVHGKTSLHYALPTAAFDIRIRGNAKLPSKQEQHAAIVLLAKDFCKKRGYPSDWLEVILEADHIHIEFQPKRIS